MELFKKYPIRLLINLPDRRARAGSTKFTVERVPSGKLYICQGIVTYCFDATEGKEFEFICPCRQPHDPLKSPDHVNVDDVDYCSPGCVPLKSDNPRRGH
jgi:hypothetical protein